MNTTLCFFNANNLFLRYRFGRKYPGDIAGKSYVQDTRWGFLPIYSEGMFEPFRPEQTEIAAAALGQEGLPDVLCLCEVESLLALRKLNSDFLDGYYDYAYLVDSRDFRQIDVGILSKKEILQTTSHIDAKEDGQYIFSRDCLEVVVALNKSGSKTLTIFINHLKSKFVDKRNKSPQKIAADTKKANKRRKNQSQEVRKIVRRRFPGTAFNRERFVVVGDLNDQPNSPWVRPLTKHADLYDVIREELPADDQWTYWWKSKNRVSQIDYLLLSPKIARDITAKNIKPRIERAGIGTKGFTTAGDPSPKTTRVFQTDDDPNPVRIDFGFPRFHEVWDDGLFASDHCPIFIDIPH